TPAGVARAEVRAALVELGYGPDEIRGALDRVRPDETQDNVEEMLRGALRELASRCPPARVEKCSATRWPAGSTWRPPSPRRSKRRGSGPAPSMSTLARDNW